MKYLIAAAALLALTSTASAQKVGGDYAAAGTNFDGSTYKGTARITVSSNSTCHITWKTGATTSEGFCMLNNSAFAAAYVLKSSVELVVYEVKPSGVLEGVWTIADKDGAGTEVLTPLK